MLNVFNLGNEFAIKTMEKEGVRQCLLFKQKRFTIDPLKCFSSKTNVPDRKQT